MEFLPSIAIVTIITTFVYLLVRRFQKKYNINLKWNGLSLIFVKQMAGFYQLLGVVFKLDFPYPQWFKSLIDVFFQASALLPSPPTVCIEGMKELPSFYHGMMMFAFVYVASERSEQAVRTFFFLFSFFFFSSLIANSLQQVRHQQLAHLCLYEREIWQEEIEENAASDGGPDHHPIDVDHHQHVTHRITDVRKVCNGQRPGEGSCRTRANDQRGRRVGLFYREPIDANVSDIQLQANYP